MIDLMQLEKEAITRTSEEVTRAAQGEIVKIRGGKSRYLLESEVKDILFDCTKPVYGLDHDQIIDVLKEFPLALFEANSGEMVFQSIIGGIQKTLMKHLLAVVDRTVLADHYPTEIETVLDDLSSTITMLELLPRHVNTFQLERMVKAVHVDHSMEAQANLAEECLRLSQEMASLSLRLDIADPPSSIVAGQLNRRLAETYEHLMRFVRKAATQDETPEQTLTR